MQFTMRWILLLAAALFGLNPQLAMAITRRHDVDDQVYINLASSDLYEAVGLWQAPGACGWSGATLIHPQWAITAAHCTPAPDATPTFKLGASETDFYLQQDPDNWFRNPDYSGGANIVNGHDFGLIHFPTPILDVTPAKLYRDVFEVDREATVIGFGRTGTGLTGEDTGLGIGVKRAATNWIDGRGGQVGWSVNVIVGDFDHPTSSVGNLPIGPSTATEFEGMIAFYDSGGAWFIEDNGQLNLAAVTSFRANTDEEADSNYGDIFGSSRITRDQAWIDSNNAASYYWTNTTGTWNTASMWDGGSVPGATETAVVTAGTVGINTPASTEYLFIDRSGTVQLN
ncbi:MAG: trypsin-like serine protease, partial [Planctomycetota bacterium]